MVWLIENTEMIEIIYMQKWTYRKNLKKFKMTKNKLICLKPLQKLKCIDYKIFKIKNIRVVTNKKMIL